ncbi:MAG: hypothetical protein H7098_07775 [Oligoflexus sp.]|nr:hypothetical protein [Pseudopedobacter sp.]
MSNKLERWLSQIDDNGIESIASLIEKELWCGSEYHISAEQRDETQREIYNELLKIKEG